MVHEFTVEIGGRTMHVETGRVAKQASGSVLAPLRRHSRSRRGGFFS